MQVFNIVINNFIIVTVSPPLCLFLILLHVQVINTSYIQDTLTDGSVLLQDIESVGRFVWCMNSSVSEF